jgi:hypothetical protein
LFESLSAIAEPPAEGEAAPVSQPAIQVSSTAESPPAAEAGVAAEAESPSAPSSVEQVPAPGAEAAEETGVPSPAAVDTPVPLRIVGEPMPLRPRQPSLPRIGPTIPGAMEKLPLWLRHVAPPIAAQQVPLAPPQAPLKTEAPAPARQDWLTRARQAARSGKLEENIAPTSPLEEIPASLADTGTELPRPIEDKESIPEWLRSVSPTAPPAQTSAGVEAPLPDWLATSEPEVNAPLPDWLATSEPEVEAPLPDWLAPSEPEVEAQVPSGAVSTDQLPGPKQSEDALWAEAEPAATEVTAPVSSQPAPSESEMPPEPPATASALPDWLQAPSGGESQPLASSPEVQVPDWLASPTSEAETLPKVETDDTIPDWLREISGEVEVAPVESNMIQSKPPESVSAEAAASDVVKPEPGVEISTKSSAEISPPPVVSQPVGAEPGVPIAEPATEAQAKGKLDFEPETLLAEARALRASGNIPRAIDLYGKILQKGPRFAAAVIADLEKFVLEPDAPLPVHRLLGDAYAQSGRFQEALEQYRTVLGK